MPVVAVDVDAVSAALIKVSRSVTAVGMSTLGSRAEQLSLRQLRVLVLVHTRGPMNLTTLARHVGINPSNAGRTCEQIVAAGFLERRQLDTDRRIVMLQLSASGSALIDDVMDRRRDVIEAAMSRMRPADQRRLAQGLAAFTAAAAEAPPEELLGEGAGRLLPWVV